MFRLEREEFVRGPYISLWATLGFQAGFLNAFGFLACGRYVSHVTGFGTQIGVALAENRSFFALEMLGFPVFFIIGSLTNGVVTAARIEQGKKPHFFWVMSVLTVLLSILTAVGQGGYFGPFGEQLIRSRDFVLLFLLSFACGMQNGCIATLTKGQIRTTHLTGISTDIGTDLARLWFGKLGDPERALTQRTNLSRVATFGAFTLGSIVSVRLSQVWEYGALIVPVFTSLVILGALWSISRQLTRRLESVSSERPVAGWSAAKIEPT